MLSGCFPVDEGASTASVNVSLTDMGVSSAAISRWLDWRTSDSNPLNFELGDTDSDFYLGLHLDNADGLYGESVNYDETTSTIKANVWVRGCTSCVFRVTIFITETMGQSLLPVRVVKTFSGASSEFSVKERESANVTMEIKQLPVGQISIRPRGNPSDEYEISLVDRDENVRFPIVKRQPTSVDSSVLFSNIPIGRIMNVQVRNAGAEAFTSVSEKGQELEITLSYPNKTYTYEFDLP